MRYGSKSKNISLNEEAYAYLSSQKKQNESFSKVILNFKKQQLQESSYLKFFGSLKDAKLDETVRKSFNKRFQ